jgi:DNA-binding response OmpR family regulator
VGGDPGARKALSTLFETSGFCVLVADTCKLAIHQAKTHRPDAVSYHVLRRVGGKEEEQSRNQ